MLQYENFDEFYVSSNQIEKLSVSNSNSFNFIFKEIFEYQIYNNIPPMEIRKNDVVVDVGAHIGIFSRYAAVNEASRIISIEMDPRFFSCLKLNSRSQDDIFNCVLLDKNFIKYKLESGILVNGFSLDYFLKGGLFNKIDFLKIDIFGKELILLNSISKKTYDVINKMSIKMYDLCDEKKIHIIEDLKQKGFLNFYNILIPNQPVQFLYFWK